MRDGELFYFCSLSAATIVYKGQLISTQIPQFYPDLHRPAMSRPRSRWCISASPPTRSRAGTARIRIASCAHNGEINTLRGNINWMHAREKLFASPLFGDDIKKLLPIIEPNGSDSAMFDNCLELLVRTGRSLPHAVMMMIPEAWQNDRADERRASAPSTSTTRA